ncbi:MAG: septal ring lytic transglycosylase RlpA family protein [Candidatus Tenebribacter davisii]|nr:septal ring lytic transglycosylase RlpA family protein [Candidatus Tenebribacter davisii]
MIRISGILIILLLNLGCSSNVQYKTKGASKDHLHQRYGKSDVYETKVKNGDEFYFVCSYYGKKFHGRQTANGEIFDMNKLTCAHKTLPFNTRLEVTNEDNEKSVIVRVNDRGPFVKGRDLDLSKAAAQEIGLIPYGFKKLKVRILNNNE